MRGQNSNALASSIVLVCRKRSSDAPSVTRGEFLRALRAELPAALHTLQESAIAPVDMAQASIGPGMAVFSRYKEVLEADDTRMSVREALRIINAELDAYLAKQEGDYDSWTRFAVTWFQQHGFDVGKYGEAEVLAKPATSRSTAWSMPGSSSPRAVRFGCSAATSCRTTTCRSGQPPDGLGGLPAPDQAARGRGRGGGGAARQAARLSGRHGARSCLSPLSDLRAQQVGRGGPRLQRPDRVSWREIIKIRDTLPDETTPGPAQAELASDCGSLRTLRSGQ